MSTKLERVSQLSRENPEMVFTSIGHMIDADLLKECHHDMDGEKAVGIDGVTKEMYAENLDENIDKLVTRLKHKAYRPQPARRTYITKDNGKKRPLSIYCYEDKLVQEALKRVLEAVFEPCFYNEMMGFRPHRGCHDALRLLNTYIEKNYTNYVLDADIKGFFDHLDHEWIIRFVESRIKDPNIVRLVRVMIKAGIMEDYQLLDITEGSGQGSICSPILANIYMHYVLIWWFKSIWQPKFKARGKFSGLVVYADDFVVCFQCKADAEEFYGHLKTRFGKFGLQLEESKTRLIEFGKFAEQNRKRKGLRPEVFTFLGFTHYCSHSKDGTRFRVKRRTSRKKFTKKLKELHNKLRDWRNRLSAGEIIKKLNEILVGYYNYYGITDNSKCLQAFKYEVQKKLFYWLNRRSQRRSYTWEAFNELLKSCPLAKPKICVNIYG